MAPVTCNKIRVVVDERKGLSLRHYGTNTVYYYYYYYYYYY